MTNTNLKSSLLAEKSSNMPGGLYHKTQVQMTYNSNRIEGSKLSEEQTRAIFETKTLGISGGEVVNVDDIIETTNHFREFDCMLSQDSLTLDYIKKLHSILKTGTADDMKTWFSVGDWKRIPNEVGDMPTTRPENVQEDWKSYLHGMRIAIKILKRLLSFIIGLKKFILFKSVMGGLVVC